MAPKLVTQDYAQADKKLGCCSLLCTCCGLTRKFSNWRFKAKYGFSRAKLKETVTGETVLLKLMEALSVTEHEAALFLKLFEKVDTDYSGTIDMHEFFTYFKLEKNRFVVSAFNVIDFDDYGMPKASSEHGEAEEQVEAEQVLTYTEFFVSLYNFCSLSHESLCRFAFAVMDTDKTGFITKDELIVMVEMLHDSAQGGSKSAHATAKQIRNIMRVLDEDKSGKISLREFLMANRKVSSLMFPAFKLQRKMRARCMTKKFWANASKNRAKAMRRAGGGDDLIQLYKRVQEEEQRRLRETEAIEAARRVVNEHGEVTIVGHEEAKQRLIDAAARKAEAVRLEAEAAARKAKSDSRMAAIDATTDKMKAVEAKFERQNRRRLRREGGQLEGERKGEWWTEGESELHERSATPDDPFVVTINQPKPQVRYEIEPATADHLVRATNAREHAAMLKEKNRIAKEHLRTMIKSIPEPQTKVVGGVVVEIPVKKKKKRWFGKQKRGSLVVPE